MNTNEAMNTTITNEEQTNTNEAIKTLREAVNASREAEAKKTLRASLLLLLSNDKNAFINSLEFTEDSKFVKVKPFVKKYEAIEAESGEAVTLEAKVKFTVFNRYDNSEDDSKEARKYKASMREAIREECAKIALYASNSPTKEEASEALKHIAETVRLIGFGEYTEKLNASDAKRILRSAYTVNAKGEDDSKDSEVKNAVQAVLYRIVNGKEEANARRQREDAKKREAEEKAKTLEEAKRIREEAKAKLDEAKVKLEEAKQAKREAEAEAKAKTKK